MSLEDTLSKHQNAALITIQDFSRCIGFVSEHCVCTLWLLAFAWLLFRALTVLQKPKSELIDRLGLIEPVAPEIVIDGLGNSWVSINWYYANPANGRGRRPRVRKHIIEIDGQVIEVDKYQRKATITNLQPNTAYQLLLRAVQIPQSDSSIISPGTQATGAASASISITSEPVGNSSNPNTTPCLSVSKSIYLCTLPSHANPPHPPLETMLKTDIPNFPRGDQHRIREIIDYQNEVREVLNQMSASETQFIAKHKALMAEYGALNSERKTDESQRTQLRVENKTLEDENHALEVQIQKIKLQAAKIAKFKGDIQRIRGEIEALDSLQADRKRENEETLDILDNEAKLLQAREAQLAQDMKYASQYAKHTESESERARNAIKDLKDYSQNASVDEKIRLLHSEASAALGQEAIQALEHEINIDNRIEREWNRAQAMLEKQYVDAYLANSQQRALELKPAELHSPPSQHASPAASQAQLVQQQTSTQHQKYNPSILDTNLVRPQPLLSNQSPPSSSAPSPVGGSSATSSSTSGKFSNPAPAANTTNMGFLHTKNRNSVGSNGSASLLHVPPSPAIRSPPPVTSMRSSNSIPQLHPMHSSSLTSLSSINGTAYDPFMVPSSSVSSLVPQQPQQPQAQPQHPYPQVVPPMSSNLPMKFQYSQQHPADTIISPTAANDLLPSNLFHDAFSDKVDDAIADEYDASLHSFGHKAAANHAREASSGASEASLKSISRQASRDEDTASTHESQSDTKLKESIWRPWLNSPGKSNSNRRTKSLFFGGVDTNSTAAASSSSQMDANSSAIDENSDKFEEAQDGESSPTSKSSPLKGMGSRFFHISGNRSGSFVRRLSIFSRKENEAKHDEEAVPRE